MPHKQLCAFVCESSTIAGKVFVYDGATQRAVSAAQAKVPWPIVYHLAARGEKFVFQLQRPPARAQLSEATDRFARSARTIFQFRNTTSTPPLVHAPSTTWRPDQGPRWLEDSLKLLTHRVLSGFDAALDRMSKRKTNLLLIDRVARSLMVSKGWSAVRSDKDGAFVLVPVQGHKEELRRVVSTADFDPPLQTPQFDVINQACVSTYNALSLRASTHPLPDFGLTQLPLRRYLLSSTSSKVCSKLFYNLKTHKRPIAPRELEDNSNNAMAPGAKLLGKLMRLAIKRDCDWVLPDSREFVKRAFSGVYVVPPGFRIVALDVVKFYPSVRHHSAQTAAEAMLRSMNLPQPVQEALSAMNQLLLNHQWIELDSVFYRRNSGVSMGGACSSEWADGHLALTGDFAFRQAVEQGRALWYARFRDDALICIREGLDLDRFHADMHLFTMLSGLRLELSIPEQNHVTWLDLDIYWGFPNAEIRTELHVKASHLGLYVSFDSGHHALVFNSWVESEVRRFVINCTSLDKAVSATESLCHAVEKRGYPDRRSELVALAKDLHSKRRDLIYKHREATVQPLPLCLPVDEAILGSGIQGAMRAFRRTMKLMWPMAPRVVLAWKNPSKHLFLKVRKYADVVRPQH